MGQNGLGLLEEGTGYGLKHHILLDVLLIISPILKTHVLWEVTCVVFFMALIGLTSSGS